MRAGGEIIARSMLYAEYCTVLAFTIFYAGHVRAAAQFFSVAVLNMRSDIMEL